MFDTRLFRPGARVAPQERDWQSFRGAINEAMREEMRRDPSVFQMGEDIALASPFGVTTGLAAEFGRERIRDAPCSEVSVVGAAVGAAIGGMRPIVELQFGDFMSVAIDQLTHQAAMLRYLTGGQVKVPMVVRLPCGAGQATQSCQAGQVGKRICGKAESRNVHLRHGSSPGWSGIEKGAAAAAARGTGVSSGNGVSSASARR